MLSCYQLMLSSCHLKYQPWHKHKWNQKQLLCLNKLKMIRVEMILMMISGKLVMIIIIRVIPKTTTKTTKTISPSLILLLVMTQKILVKTKTTENIIHQSLVKISPGSSLGIFLVMTQTILVKTKTTETINHQLLVFRLVMTKNGFN